MSCVRTFDTATNGLFSGIWATGQTFDFLGYSPTEGGTFSPTDAFPESFLWGFEFDASGLLEGFYKFKYHTTDLESECYGEFEFNLSVVQGTFVMETSDIEIELCPGDAIRNIFDDLDVYDPSTFFNVEGELTGDTGSPAFDAGADFTESTFDPSLEPSVPITREYILTYTPVAPDGYVLLNCGNCDPKSRRVIYTVIEGFVPDDQENIAPCAI